jgi:2'-5' RNA ligase
MPRLFTAFAVPSDIATSLSFIRGGLYGARWIESRDYHMTLRFIGDVDHRQACEIDQQLTYISRSPLTLTLDGLTTFGGDRPRALVAHVQESDELMRLQAEQERLMRRIGLAPEARKFTPHVTLARLQSVSAQDVALYLAQCGLFRKSCFVASKILLMSSRQSLGGGPYHIEAEYPLTA